MRAPTTFLSGAFALLAALPIHADLQVAGSVAYVDRAHGYGGWTGEEPLRPVRYAVVDVIDEASGLVLATGTTASDGGFALGVAGSGTADLVVRAYTSCTELAPSEISVRAESQVGPLYSVSSAVFPGHSLGVDLDVGEIVADELLVGNLRSNPFDIYEAAIRAEEYAASFDLPRVTLPVGAIFPSPTGLTNAGGPSYVNISASDGYDDVVVLHEFGHTYDARYDWIRSIGGPHGFGQSDQEPSLAFNEGFATYFSAAVREHAGDPRPGYYLDAKAGDAIGVASVGLRMRLEDRKPYVGTTAGEADEVAVCAALWDLHDHADTDDPWAGDDDLADGAGGYVGGLTGKELVVAALENIAFPTNDDLYHVVDFFDAIFYGVGETDYDAVRDAFELQGIRMFEDLAEPDDEPASAAPIFADLGWSAVRTLYASDDEPPAPGGRDQDFFTFTAEAGRIYEVETRYPKGVQDAETYCDPALAVWTAGGEFLESDFDAGFGRNARLQVVSTEGDELVVRVRAQNPYRPTGSYQLRVRDVGEATAPFILTFDENPMPTAIETWFPGNAILGSGFLGTTSVTVDGEPAQFWVANPGKIDLLLPLVDTVGPVEVVVTNAFGSATALLTLEAPTTPTLFAVGSYGVDDTLRVRCGSQPGEVGLLFVSTSFAPTTLPGVAALDIGAGGSDLTLAFTFPTNAAGLFETEIPYVDPGGSPLPIFLQAVLVPPGTAGPWPTTNRVTAYL